LFDNYGNTVLVPLYFVDKWYCWKWKITEHSFIPTCQLMSNAISCLYSQSRVKQCFNIYVTTEGISHIQHIVGIFGIEFAGGDLLFVSFRKFFLTKGYRLFIFSKANYMNRNSQFHTKKTEGTFTKVSVGQIRPYSSSLFPTRIMFTTINWL